MPIPSTDAADVWGAALTALVVLVLAMAIALTFHFLIFGSLKRMAARSKRKLSWLLYAHGRRPVRWLLVLLAIALALPWAPLPDKVRAALDHSLWLCIIAGCGWALVEATDVAVEFIDIRYRGEVDDELAARSIQTQAHVLRRVISVVVVIVTLALMLLTFPAARTAGTSLLASAGLAGLVLGMAMRPTLANLVAGVQIALTKPIRLNDEVVVEAEWGTVEEITSTYVVLRLWDLRHMILPLSYFIEHPFQNWTRTTPTFIGTVFLYVDYTAPMEAIRREMEQLVRASPLWNGSVCALVVTDANDRTLQLRITADAAGPGQIFGLRCAIREGMVQFLQQYYPHCLPKTRTEIASGPALPPEP